MCAFREAANDCSYSDLGWSGVSIPGIIGNREEHVSKLILRGPLEICVWLIGLNISKYVRLLRWSQITTCFFCGYP